MLGQIIGRAEVQKDERLSEASASPLIPATMAAIYLLLLLYFKSIGGYKPLTIDDQAA
jgi:hypothetical protein